MNSEKMIFFSDFKTNKSLHWLFYLKYQNYSILFFLLSFMGEMCGGIMDNGLAWEICQVNYIHLCANTPEKGMNPSPPLAMS